MTATEEIYLAAGHLPIQDGEVGVCRSCGVRGYGESFVAWVRATFTDHDKLRPGEIVCHACLFCFDENNALLQTRLNKDKPQRMRNYSHFVVNGAWHPLSKGEKAQMREILLNQAPTVAVIADSGQKHIIFRARVGWWQFEEHGLRPDPERLTMILVPFEGLYRAGATKNEIESGRYAVRTIHAIGIDQWRELESALREERGTLIFKLAAFLAQKGTNDNDA
jgi:hypothetical protein